MRKIKKFEEVTGHQSDNGHGSGKCCGMCISCHVYKNVITVLSKQDRHRQSQGFQGIQC